MNEMTSIQEVCKPTALLLLLLLLYGVDEVTRMQHG